MAHKRLIVGLLLVNLLFGFLTPGVSVKPAQAATTVTIYQANLQHGQSTDGAFDYGGQANLLAPGVDLVTTNEVSVGDLPNWDRGFAANGMSRAIYFPNAVSGGDGNAIWYRNSTVTLLGTYSHQLSNGFIGWDGFTIVDNSAVAVKVSVNGKVFYSVAAHLCYSRCADSNGSKYSKQRVAQINELLSWVSTTLTDADVVISGDMNFGPDYPREPDPALQIDLFTAGYDDLWAVGLATGQAAAPWGDRDGNGIEDMPLASLTTRTHDSRRIDYFFLKKNAADLSLNSITVPDLRAICPQPLVSGACPNVIQRWGFADDAGVRPSDHNWVKTVFDISATTPLPDTTGPTVSLTAPTDGATVTGTVAVNAAASDNTGVSSVQFKLDGTNLGAEVTTVPYTLAWDTAAVSDGPHQLTAVARDAAGNSTTSAPIAVTVRNMVVLPSPPAAPTNLTGTPLSNLQIRLNWSDNATDETGYKVERCKGTACTTFAQIATVGVNIVTFTNSGLNKNNVYRYRVRAYNSVGNSSYSNIVEVKILK